MNYHEYYHHHHHLRHHHHLTLLSLWISNPKVYPPLLFPYRWVSQQEPDQELKAMSEKICKKWMTFFSFDFPVANPRFLLYCLFVCLFWFFDWFLVAVVVVFVVCYLFILFLSLIIKPDMEGTACMFSFLFS